jgi:hypothetical protein
MRVHHLQETWLAAIHGAICKLVKAYSATDRRATMHQARPGIMVRKLAADLSVDELLRRVAQHAFKEHPIFGR